MKSKIKLSDKAMAYIRLAVFALPLINAILMVAGLSPLPIDEHQLELVLSMGAGFIFSLYAWFKNNNITKPAQEAQKYLEELKSKK